MLFELPHFALELLVVLPCVQVGLPPAVHASTAVQQALVLPVSVWCCHVLACRAREASHGADMLRACWAAVCRAGGHALCLLQRPCNVPVNACRYCAAGCESWHNRTYASPCRRGQRTVRRLQRSGLAGRRAPSQPPPRLGQRSAERGVPLALTLTPTREQAPTVLSAGYRT